ncbi:MAG: hypothetical protein OXK80_02930 [Bdellovibrionales bacterium]|nr:hypothetical protein [Bdellovibrionales bacterium]
MENRDHLRALLSDQNIPVYLRRDIVKRLIVLIEKAREGFRLMKADYVPHSLKPHTAERSISLIQTAEEGFRLIESNMNINNKYTVDRLKREITDKALSLIRTVDEGMNLLSSHFVHGENLDKVIHRTLSLVQTSEEKEQLLQNPKTPLLLKNALESEVIDFSSRQRKTGRGSHLYLCEESFERR